MSAALVVDGLHVRLDGRHDVVSDVSFRLGRGRTLALVGESGCGKSVTAMGIIGLLPTRRMRIVGGRVDLEGAELTGVGERERRHLLGSRVGTVFQDPASALNTAYRIGEQIAETLRVHRELSWDDAEAQAVGLLREVGFPDPERQVALYPHQLSGGMKQRVVIAIALACDPAVLIADEPTTALDVTIQAAILKLIDELRRSRDLGVLLVTHDFGVVARSADDVAVMYAGRIVEQGTARVVLTAPRHPYTRALLRAIVRPDTPRRVPLEIIEGAPPSPQDRPSGCAFRTRCPLAQDVCAERVPVLAQLGGGHTAACHVTAGVGT